MLKLIVIIALISSGISLLGPPARFLHSHSSLRASEFEVVSTKHVPVSLSWHWIVYSCNLLLLLTSQWTLGSTARDEVQETPEL